MTNDLTPASMRLELLPGQDSDAADLSQTAVDLRRQLLLLDVEDAELMRDVEATAGAKAADALSLGHVLITAVPTASLLSAVVAVLRARIKAAGMRSVKITIGNDSFEVTGHGVLDEAALLVAWDAQRAKNRPAG